MARMKVVIRGSVANLGEAGDVVTVAGGYARNYLIPRGLAVVATKGALAQAETWKRSLASKAQREAAEAETLRQRLEAAPLTIGASAGPDGRLFGSITAANIASALAEKLGVSVERHSIVLTEPIRHLGFHQVEIRLHRETTASLTVEAVESAEA